MRIEDQFSGQVEAFDPKVHPAVRQSQVGIRAFGIEFKSRHGVLSKLRQMILAVETWLPRGLFWHTEKIDYDSKGGSVIVTLKERDGSMASTAREIASVLRNYMGDMATCVFVADHDGHIIGDAPR